MSQVAETIEPRQAGQPGQSGRGGPRERASSSRQDGPTQRPYDYDVMSPACPSRTVLRHVVDRWTPLVVAVLAQGPRRFSDLRRAVGGVTPKVLTQTLRSMERDGLVLRDVTAGVPPRVEYQLTELGRGLAEPVAALRAWVESSAGQVLAARAAYDAAQHTASPVAA